MPNEDTELNNPLAPKQDNSWAKLIPVREPNLRYKPKESMVTTLQDEVRQLRTSIIKTIEGCEASRTCDLCKMSIDNRITTFVQQQREAATLAEREACAQLAATAPLSRFEKDREPTLSDGIIREGIARHIRARSNQ